ncbi:hypothetical protein Q3G72_023677 [Acer saccharum]|nr:hypothetical protein Q3G72_023677 [Acer saccharum]
MKGTEKKIVLKLKLHCIDTILQELKTALLHSYCNKFCSRFGVIIGGEKLGLVMADSRGGGGWDCFCGGRFTRFWVMGGSPCSGGWVMGGSPCSGLVVR